MALDKYKADGTGSIALWQYRTAAPKKVRKKKDKFLKKTAANIAQISQLQEKLYADGRESLIIVLQAMDAAGKDSLIKHVMTGINPQGVRVTSYKVPSAEELSHDFLWRFMRDMPARGNIAIFNRSYYEDVLVVKVRKIYQSYHMAERSKGDDIIKRRYREIAGFEQYLYDNSYRVVKLFLNVSKDEQKKRFLERIDQKIKNWKYSSSDLKERMLWDDYQTAYEDAINATATPLNPWYILPADNKWYTRYLASEAILQALKKINPQFPELSDDERARLSADQQTLLNER